MRSPLQRLISILACLSFLLTGGLGTSARVILCTGADGRVRLETPFSLCCEEDPAVDEDAHGHEAGSGEAPAASALASDDCGACSDQVLVIGKDHKATRRALASATDHESRLTLFAAILPPCCGNQGDAGTVGAAGHLIPPPGTAHSLIQTVVLRC